MNVPGDLSRGRERRILKKRRSFNTRTGRVENSLLTFRSIATRSPMRFNAASLSRSRSWSLLCDPPAPDSTSPPPPPNSRARLRRITRGGGVGGGASFKQRRSPRERGRTGTRKRAPQRLWARRAREGISPPAAGGDPARTRARASAREREDARTWGPGSRTSSASPAGCGPHGMTCDDDQLLTVHVHVHVLYVYVYSCTRTQTRRPLPWSGRHVRKYGSTFVKVLSKVRKYFRKYLRKYNYMYTYV